MRHCAIPGCRSRSHMKGISLHQVPTKDVFADMWRDILCSLPSTSNNGKQEGLIRITPSTRICSNHFLDKDFRTTPNGVRHLLEGAVPSVFDKKPTCSAGKKLISKTKKGKGENSIKVKVSPKEKKVEKQSLQNLDLSDMPQGKGENLIKASPKEIKVSLEDIKILPTENKVEKQSLQNLDLSDMPQGKGENSIKVSPKENKVEKQSLQNSDLSDMPQENGNSVSVSPKKKSLKSEKLSRKRTQDSDIPSVPKGKDDNSNNVSPKEKFEEQSLQNSDLSDMPQEKADNSAGVSTRKRLRKSTQYSDPPSVPKGKVKNSIKISRKVKKENKEPSKNGKQSSAHQDEIKNSIQGSSRGKKIKKGPVYASDLPSSRKKGDKYCIRPLRVKKPPIKLRDPNFDSGSTGEDRRASRKHIIIVRGTEMFAAVTEKQLESGEEVWKIKHIVRVKNSNCPKLLIRNVDLFARVEVDNSLMEPICEIRTNFDEDGDGRETKTLAQEQITESTTVPLKKDSIQLNCPDCESKNQVAILKPYEIGKEFTIFVCPTEECLFPLGVTDLHKFLYKNLPNGTVMQCNPAEAPTLNDIVAVLTSDNAVGSPGTS